MSKIGKNCFAVPSVFCFYCPPPLWFQSREQSVTICLWHLGYKNQICISHWHLKNIGIWYLWPTKTHSCLCSIVVNHYHSCTMNFLILAKLECSTFRIHFLHHILIIINIFTGIIINIINFRVLTTVKNYVVSTVFSILPMAELPNLFPKYFVEYQNVKRVNSNLKVRKVREKNIVVI